VYFNYIVNYVLLVNKKELVILTTAMGWKDRLRGVIRLLYMNANGYGALGLLCVMAGSCGVLELMSMNANVRVNLTLRISSMSANVSVTMSSDISSMSANVSVTVTIFDITAKVRRIQSS
jgi:hypothetical protein